MNTFSPVYISNYFENKNFNFHENNKNDYNICSDLLDNMKYCLHKCRDNKKIYSIYSTELHKIMNYFVHYLHNLNTYFY